ncbi:hypothetical protein GGF50DRAFT_113741 [Schizophyllum commune]
MLDERLFKKVVYEVSLDPACNLSVRSSVLVPTPDALRHWAVLSEDETRRLKSAIADEIDSLRIYTDTIAKVNDFLRALKRTYDLMSEAIALKNSLVSKIRRLPTEILAIIIIDVMLLHSPQDSMSRMAHPVTRVCHRWREISLSLPEIWTNIDVSAYTGFDWCAMFAECLCRAQAKPLSLTLGPAFGARRESTPATFAQVFLASTTQWRSLALVNLQVSPWFTHEELHLPALESLRIDNSSVAGGFSFTNCPALHSVVLHDAVVADFNLPWAQLTSLTVQCKETYWDTAACLGVLRGCERLLTLELSAMVEDRHHPDVVLPSLTSLTLRRNASRLLGAFHAPCLQYLEVASHSDLGRLETYAMERGTICSTLTSLALLAFDNESDWVRLFELYTNISELQVLVDAAGRGVATLARALGHRQDLLPDLVHLDLPNLHVRSPGSVHALESIINCRVHLRLAGATPLARLSFDSCDPAYVSRLRVYMKPIECRARWPEEDAENLSDDEDASFDEAFARWSAQTMIMDVQPVLGDPETNYTTCSSDHSPEDEEWIE